MKNDITEILKHLFKFLEKFMEVDEALRDHLTAVMEPEYFPEDKVLFSKSEQVTSLFFIASGYMAFSVLGYKTDGQVTDLFTKGGMVIAPSAIDGSEAAHDLKVTAGTFALVLSTEKMELTYKCFPKTEGLFKLILNDNKKRDMEKVRMLHKRGIDSVYEFYTLYPDLLVKRRSALKDAEIASYLLMDEKTLSRNRSRLLHLGRLYYFNEINRY